MNNVVKGRHLTPCLFQNTVHVSIGGGRYNEIINNVMYNARLRSIEFDSRGLGHYSDSGLLNKLHVSTRPMEFN